MPMIAENVRFVREMRVIRWRGTCRPKREHDRQHQFKPHAASICRSRTPGTVVFFSKADWTIIWPKNARPFHLQSSQVRNLNPRVGDFSLMWVASNFRQCETDRTQHLAPDQAPSVCGMMAVNMTHSSSRQLYCLALAIGLIQSAGNAQPPMPAEPQVTAANRAVLSQLPFNDRQDFEDANRVSLQRPPTLPIPTSTSSFSKIHRPLSTPASGARPSSTPSMVCSRLPMACIRSAASRSPT
jgi:hypothetical protein